MSSVHGKYGFSLLITLLIASNALWLFAFSRLDDKLDFETDRACTAEQLVELKDRLQQIKSAAGLIQNLKDDNFDLSERRLIKAYEPQKYEGKEIITITSPAPCNRSTRLGCGFNLFLDGDQILDINEWYPCH